MREIPSCEGAFIPLGRFIRVSNSQLTQSEIILYVAHNNEKQVRGHVCPRRRSRDEIAFVCRMPLIFLSHRCNLLIPDRVRRCIHCFTDFASAHGCPEGGYCIFYIRSCAEPLLAPIAVNSRTVHVLDFDSIALPKSAHNFMTIFAIQLQIIILHMISLFFFIKIMNYAL